MRDLTSRPLSKKNSLVSVEACLTRPNRLKNCRKARQSSGESARDRLYSEIDRLLPSVLGGKTENSGGLGRSRGYEISTKKCLDAASSASAVS